jgi:glycosyltransferase involved in cell wall biosynthesis
MHGQNSLDAGTAALAGKRVLIIVENLPVPFDRRVWLEARALRDQGAEVSVICPTGKGFETRYEVIDGIHIYRHSLGLDASSALGYLREYATALTAETWLAWKIYFQRGFDVMHACNPPDLIFLVAAPFKLFGVKFLFDHHDVNPELYEAKFGRRDFFWRLMILFERLTFLLADVSIATNQSYRKIALTRGGMSSDDVFVVRTGPDLSAMKLMEKDLRWNKGRKYLIGYVGVMGDQEGIDLLLETVDYMVHVRNRRDAQFVLVGGGSSLEKLKADCSARGLEDYVTFLGRAPDADLFSVLSSADVCVNPDRVNAMNDLSTMNKILEYMAMGKPIVQFDVTEGRYSAGDASLYAKPNDTVDFAEKIFELLDNPELRARAGAIGRERLETRFCWVHQTPSLIEAYRRLFSKKAWLRRLLPIGVAEQP